MDTRKWLKVAAIACASVLLVEVVYWIGVAVAVERPDSAGTFGDMFGALNTFFAGLGFAGVVFTLYLQISASAEARRDQAETLNLVQNEVSLIREDVELQRQRDRVEAGPFFRLSGASISGSTLDFAVDNVGAAVIVRDFKILNSGCSVRDWSPSTLPPNTRFSAPCSINNASQREYKFHMSIRDRWGMERSFELQLTTSPTAKLDFFEIEARNTKKPTLT